MEKNFENSLFMIKPDSYEYKEEILKELSKEFDIIDTTDMIATEEFLLKLYSGERGIFKNLNIQYLKNKEVLIGILSGINCKQRLMDLCGKDFRPSYCEKDTIRAKYSKIIEPIDFYGEKLYINAIHRASPEDADDEVELYKKEILKEKKYCYIGEENER